MIDCLLKNYHTESLITLMNCLGRGNNPYLFDLSRLVDRKILEEKAYRYLKNLVSRNKWDKIDELQRIRQSNNDKTLFQTVINQGLV